MTCAATLHARNRYKSEHLHPAGLLMPLPVPQGVWTDIALDFVEAMPRVRGKSVILTVVDRFSKYCHFIPLAHPYSAESVAQAFFTEIVRLHGMPQSMVSDRDPVFTSTFWRELMRLMGTKLHMTTAFHPQSDGQSEAANRLSTTLYRPAQGGGGTCRGPLAAPLASAVLHLGPLPALPSSVSTRRCSPVARGLPAVAARPGQGATPPRGLPISGSARLPRLSSASARCLPRLSSTHAVDTRGILLGTHVNILVQMAKGGR
ncbi:hypothetical protein E2562_030506 [Oryza meyeriana var. granulata]|uniref:Integrase catalytic domain-containing protein n=1 Tax=Oryza meyeriana var. granulata TaxID=110450 RepID=A0A6G1BPL1_9ORYZ|nr:hypothetical protein E2562_030506 [Oryza meyeriana var. granulata]